MKTVELNWLSRRKKWLRLPSLIFVPGESDWIPEAGGYYVAPEAGDFFFEGAWRDCTRGMIVVLTDCCETIEETLAHEWRHHWQAHKGICLPGGMTEGSTYEEQVRNHFRRPVEADALRFTLKVCGREAAPRKRETLKMPSRIRSFSFPHETRN